MGDAGRACQVECFEPPPPRTFYSLDASLLLQNATLPPSVASRISGGFDNVGFDLESLGEAGPGSRKPVVSTRMRTVSPDEHVLATLSRQPNSLPSFGYFCLQSSSVPSHADPVSDEDGLEAARTYTSVSVIRVDEDVKGNPAVSEGFREYIDDDGASSSKDTDEEDGISFEKEGRPHEDIHEKELFRCSRSKKTASQPSEPDCGLSAASERETMVRVGSLSSRSSSSSTSGVQVISSPSVVPKETTLSSPSRTSVARVPLLSDVRTIKVSNGGVVVDCDAIPTVSALSKVSSVRIVPTPTATPTPSVDNGSQSSRGGPLKCTRLKSPAISPGKVKCTSSSSAPPRPSNSSDPSSHEAAPTTDAPPARMVEPAAEVSGPQGGRRGDRERRRERRERRRERRAQRLAQTPQTQTEVTELPPVGHDAHLPDLLNSHIPPPYSTLPSGAPQPMGGIIAPPSSAPPPPLPLQLPPPPPGGPLGSGFPCGNSNSPLRPPPPDSQWNFFGSRRSRCSGHGATYYGEEEAKSCCGLLVTQAVSIRWFIIMIAFVGLCCTVVGTVLGAVKTHNSDYVTITLLMIGVGIVLITVSGVAWHLTSRDAPCRVMLGLSSSSEAIRGESRRFVARMAPAFGRPHHPYAAMMYPEFQYRPPPPTYQASMQDYRLRLLLLDQQGHGGPPNGTGLTSPPPTYRPGMQRGLGVNTLGRDSSYSRPPSYRSREGPVSQHPNAPPNPHPGGSLEPVHSRDPSCLSIFSHESLYSTAAPPSSQDGSSSKLAVDIEPGVGGGGGGGGGGGPDSGDPFAGSKKNEGSSKRDGNTVTIVQTTDSSQVIGSDSVVVTVSGSEVTRAPLYRNADSGVSVLAHL